MTIDSANYLTELHQLLNQYFSLAEIRTLCFQLNVDYESVSGEEKPSRIRELLLALGRNGRLPKLITLLQKERPNIDWPLVPKDFEMPESLASGEIAMPTNQYHVYGDMVQGDKVEGDKVAGHKIQTQTYIEKQVIVSGLENTDIENLPPAPCDPPCVPPYQGLLSYDIDDYDRFFGRETLTAQLVNRLHDTRFLAVVGASGSGKSSVVRAGVVPAMMRWYELEDGTEPPLGQWQALIMTPTARPLTKLAVTLFPDDEVAQSQLYEQIVDLKSTNALATAVANRVPKDGTHKLLLIVDQFEELFTLCKEIDQRQLMVNNLLTAAAHLPQVRIIVTLRADFYDQAIQLEGLEKTLEQNQVIVTQMREEELENAILKPAELGKWQLQAGLTEQMLTEVGAEPGALPLLSHALLETWKRRRDRIMTLSGYVEAGGVRKAIAQTATRTYENLPPEQQVIAKQTFLRLTELGQETQDTRRRVELTEIRIDEKNHLVLKKLADARLIKMDRDVVEVAHEALIREWKTLREWLSVERDELIIHRRLTNAAQNWQQKEGDPSYLYIGLRLTEAAQWAETNSNVLNTLERSFLDTSLAAEERRQRTRRFIQIGGAAVLAILIMLGIGVVLINNERDAAIEAGQTAVAAQATSDNNAAQEEIARGTAEAAAKAESESRSTAVAAQNRAEGEATIASIARTTAVAAQATSDANASLAATHEEEARAVSEAVSGVNLLDADKELALLLATHALQQHRSWIIDDAIRTILSNSGYTRIFIPDLNGNFYRDSMIAWSLNGDEVLKWIDSGQVVAVSPHTQKERVILNSFRGNINDLLAQLQDIEPDVWPPARQWPDTDEEKHSSSNGQFILVQEETTTQLQRTEDNDSVCEVVGKLLYWSLPWNVTGTQFFTVDQTAIDVWDTDCTHVARLTGDSGAITWAEWSPNSEFIAGVSETSHGRVWGLEPIMQPTALDDLFEAWSPHEAQLLLTHGQTENQVIRIWDQNAGKMIAEIPAMGHAGTIYPVDNWSPDGSHSVIFSENEVAQIWETETWTHQMDLIGHEAQITGVSWAPDGQQLVTGSQDGTARVWNAINGEIIYAPLEHDSPVISIAWSPNGKYIATGSEDKFVRVWEAQSGQLLHKAFFKYLSPGAAPLRAIEWNPNPESPLLLLQSGDSRSGDHIWDITTGTYNELSYQDLPLGSAEWNVTGSHIAAFSKGEVFVMSADSLSTPKRIGNRRISWNPVKSTNNLIATQGDNASILIWDLKTDTIVDTFNGHSGDIYTIEWNSSGDKLATVGADSTLRIWKIGNPVALAVININSSERSYGYWSADDNFIAHRGQGLGVQIFYVKPENLREIACNGAVRNLSAGEAIQYLGIELEKPICPGKPVPDEDYDLPEVLGGVG